MPTVYLRIGHWLLAGWLVLLFCQFASGDEPFDLLIRGGKLVDGTGNPWFLADLGVRDGKIAAIGPLANHATNRTLDARGLIVSPGFIDIHSHSDALLLEDGAAHSKIRQGVTTEILGEGDSAGPNQGPRAAEAGQSLVRWPTLGAYFQALESSGSAVNVGSYVGLNNIWQSVMGQAFDRPTAEQRQAMQKLVAEAMEDGALGLSSQLMMPPGSLATRDEVVELARVAGRYGGIYSTHIRNEGTGVFDSVREAIEIGERAGLPVDVIHLKIADQKHWGRMREVVALIDAARRRGVNVQANVYPYTRGNNNLSSIIPPWAHEGGTQAMLKRIQDPAQRPRIKHDITHGVEGWYNHYTAVGGDWSRMLISANTGYKGMTLDRVLSLRAKGQSEEALLEAFLDYLVEEEGSVSTVYAHHTEADMTLALTQPWTSIGSDGSAFAAFGALRRGHPHPRNFGTFPRVLGEYVREKKLLTLEDAVRKMTSLNAQKIGLTDRGLLRVGMAADITLFDAAKIADRSTYEDPFQYPVGISHVLVNGAVVLNPDGHTGAKPGKVLRRGK